jgi:hypothetical protein
MHNKWPELVPHLQKRINSTVYGTGYTPIELLNGEERPDLFKQILKIKLDQQPNNQLRMSCPLSY